MLLKSPSSSVAKLRRLVDQARSGELLISTFCESFERIYNFELDKKILSDKEFEEFSKMFDLVVLFSPYPDELARIQNYRSEADIRIALNAFNLE